MDKTEQTPPCGERATRESPEFVRTSLAASMTMGKVQGKFYRDAKLYCINLLMTYDEGCHAKCAYCGLSGSRQTDSEWIDNSFIRVDWPVFSVEEVKEAIAEGKCPHVERVCVSMITTRQAKEDLLKVVSELKQVIDHVSILITPTIIDRDWLVKAREAGADKVGVAIDAATPELFDRLRGKGVGGPHKWKKYWQILADSVEVFGRYEVGVHLIVGLGETESQIVEAIQRAYDMGAYTHLFSFFPEEGSLMGSSPQPPLGAYRRVQLARYLINEGLAQFSQMSFNEAGQLTDFGVPPTLLEEVIRKGEAFMTSGCSSPSHKYACNRPFGNCTPYQASIGHWRNIPFQPTEEDIDTIRTQIRDYSLEYKVADPEFD
ncbi:MAG: radical SAM protein [Candidatus Thorarchaeota archaeon]|nr:radical SAM protein [Candidatus Thorarchaeota archaeon]